MLLRILLLEIAISNFPKKCLHILEENELKQYESFLKYRNKLLSNLTLPVCTTSKDIYSQVLYSLLLIIENKNIAFLHKNYTYLKEVMTYSSKNRLDFTSKSN